MGRDGIILCDFDGTITKIDVTDRILERYALPEWLEVERQWQSGKISSQVCMAQQVAMIRAEPQELDECIDAVPLTQGFVEFALFCRQNALPLYIVSDGIDYVIERVLARCGLAEIPVVANRLITSNEGFSLAFPYAQEGCGAGVCKCGVAGGRVGRSVVIGDGLSDACVAEKVAMVYTRHGMHLEKHCQDKRISHIPFDDFYPIIETIQQSIT